MKTVAFHNLGCKVNTYEMDVMQQKFEERGYKIVPFSTKADIYVVNTCTVTNIADRKSRQMLHKAKKENPDSVVVATGCYVQTDAQNAEKDEAIDIIIGNNNKTKVVDLVEEHIAANKEKTAILSDIDKNPEYEACSLRYSTERTRVDIKIQDGCNQFCSYCLIPMARGRVRSRKKEEIFEEINNLANQGYKEVVITGIHLSSYGLDFYPDEKGKVTSYNSAAGSGEYTNKDLLEVIDRVSEIEGIKRIRLGSLEPRIITREFLERISKNGKICPHFHLSLQSGCDETLKRMNRQYTTEEFYEKTCLIREYFDKPAITTDIITGFPGENPEEFEETYDFVKKICFYETHIFKYSRRKGTTADKMPGQNTDAVKSARSDRLIELSKNNSYNFRKEKIGKVLEILTEEEKEIDGISYLLGHTKDYCPAIIEKAGHEVNTLLSGQAVKIRDDGLLLLSESSK